MPLLSAINVIVYVINPGRLTTTPASQPTRCEALVAKLINMTNVESYLSRAQEALEAGLLTSYEASFIEYIQDYDKKQLKSLSSKQFDLLRSIANKHTLN